MQNHFYRVVKSTQACDKEKYVPFVETAFAYNHSATGITTKMLVAEI
jgi:hypothetical protein